MRTGVKILVGCLAAPFVLLLVLGVLALAYRAMPLQPSERTAARLEQPVDTFPGVTPRQLAAEGLSAADVVPAGRAMPVHLWLEEGSFTVKPGPPGSAIRVEGDYDRGMYDLKQDLGTDASGGPIYRLSFRPRYSMMRRLLSQGFVNFDESTNNLTIHLPKGMPMVLHARVMKGSSRLHLGGLALESADLDLSMGEHRLMVEEPNPIPMSALELNVGMGEAHLDQLGNLRSGSITIWGKMGEVDVDLGREILRDTKLFTRMRMGEMTVGLPRAALVRGSTSVFLGEGSGIPDASADEAGAVEGAHAIDVSASASLGELKFHRN